MGGVVFMDSDRGIMGEQLSLFQDKDMLLNGGSLELKKLNLDEAKKAFQSYKDLYKDGGNIDGKLKVTDYLIQGFSNAPGTCPDEPAYLYGLWNSFEDFVKSIRFESENIVSEIKNSFFQKLLASVDRCNLADASYLSDNTPMGYVYMQAGKYDLAVESLQTCVLTTPENTAIYGYLGDAYTLRGDPATARKCYLEACLIGAADIDWGHVKDKEMLNLREQLIETFDMNDTLATEWLPSYAYIGGLFKPKMIRHNEELKKFVDEYLTLWKAYLKEPASNLEPKLFIRAIVLCDNEPFMKLVKGIDFVNIRRQMKEINPSLFSGYMKHIKGRNREKG
jgi:hypothetical protein